MPRTACRALTLVAALMVVARSLPAQAVHGRLRAADSTAVTGAIVALVDSTGATTSRVLSSAIGSFTLRAPRPGRYLVRVLRIGFPAFDSTGFVLRSGETNDYSPVLPDTPIVLSEIDVKAGSACRAGTDQAGVTATLLEEVRKAFGSIDLALRDHDLRFEVRHFAKRTDKNAVLVAQDSAVSTMSSWPVHSLPPELLRDRGFVIPWDSVDGSYLPLGVTSGKVWFGPDATTLFAEPFLATHCYHAERDAHDSTRIGLAFEPVHGRHLPEITGTLWLRRGTLALESLRYEYVNLPRQFRDARNGATGGTMEFARLPVGLWVVSSWDLRVPIEEVDNNVPIGIGGYLEEGGRVGQIRTTQGVIVH